MSKADTRKLQAFQRQTLAYEKLLLRTIRQFIGDRGNELVGLALTSNWDKFHDVISSQFPSFQKRFNYILRELGTQTLAEVK